MSLPLGFLLQPVGILGNSKKSMAAAHVSD
jgi:hypothetical protein